MNEANFKNKLPATLQSIEGDYAYFKFQEETEVDEPNFKWPIKRLPEGLEIGDQIDVQLVFEMAEDRKAELMKREEMETEYSEKRKLLEELVN
ncbi:hypothetical protein ACFL3C_03665 [Patescibacteria group bacterium]